MSDCRDNRYIKNRYEPKRALAELCKTKSRSHHCGIICSVLSLQCVEIWLLHIWIVRYSYDAAEFYSCLSGLTPRGVISAPGIILIKFWRLLSGEKSSVWRVLCKNVTVAFFLKIVMRGFNGRHIVSWMSVSLMIHVSFCMMRLHQLQSVRVSMSLKVTFCFRLLLRVTEQGGGF